jgi:hypothetical protein
LLHSFSQPSRRWAGRGGVSGLLFHDANSLLSALFPWSRSSVRARRKALKYVPDPSRRTASGVNYSAASPALPYNPINPFQYPIYVPPPTPPSIPGSS